MALLAEFMHLATIKNRRPVRCNLKKDEKGNEDEWRLPQYKPSLGNVLCPLRQFLAKHPKNTRSSIFLVASLSHAVLP